MTADFIISGTSLNAKVVGSKIQNIAGLVVNSQAVLNDLTNRFAYPLMYEISNNLYLFGNNGVKFSFLQGKSVASSQSDDGVTICFK